MPKFSTTVKMNTLISMIHFRLHNYMTHLSNVLKLSRRFATKWNFLFWKYKIDKFYFGYRHWNPWNHENWYPWRKVLSQYLCR